jgi:hypothetical protein
MKVYVAAKYEERHLLVKPLLAVLRVAGHEITHDWTNEDDAGLAEPDLSAYHALCARDDLRGASECDVLVLLPHEKGRGLWVEVGCALAMGRRVLVVGDPGDAKTRCIFLNGPLVRWVPNCAQVVNALKDGGR